MRIGQQPSTEEILAEIKRQFGFIPSFFAPALSMPQLLENLWQQILTGYINNPLPSLFKEQLLTSLSRYCHVPYCVVCHSSALHAAGMTAKEILALLETPLPDAAQIEKHLAILTAESGPLTAWPERGSALERALLASAIALFAQSNAPLRSQASSPALPDELAKRNRNELERVLGESYHYLTTLLAYMQWQHFWIESHPEISLANDQPVQKQLNLLLAEEPRLADFFETDRKGGETENASQQRLLQEREEARAAQMVTFHDISERKRLESALLHAELLARERFQQLETIFETMVEGVMVFDSNARIIQMNSAARKILGVESQLAYAISSASERLSMLRVQNEHGEPLAERELPVERILHGETLNDTNSVYLHVHTLDGRDIILNTIGAPIRDEQGDIIGAVTINRDVTQQRQLIRRTHETLNALLEMAEAMVQTSGSIPDLEIPPSFRSSSAVGHRLAELTCSVLGCSRVGIIAVEPETEITRTVAVVGLSQEQERQWWIEQEQQVSSLRDSPMPELVARLRANEILVLDMTQPPFNTAPNPYQIYSMLMAPMCVGNELVGLLTLDFGATEHTYTPDELALTQAVARLGALVIERERLLHEQAQAQASIIALSEANRRMDDFLSMASHELRTPLTSIKGNIQLVERRLNNLIRKESEQGEMQVKSIGPLHEMLERADRQVKLLNRLVGDLLDVSRIQASKLELKAEPFDLASVVREAVQEQRQAHPARTITLEIAQEPVPANGDADRIGQVVTNFLTNALKYSDADRPVEIRLCVEGENAHLSVQDEGPGLQPEERERIWERFYQAPGIEVRSGSGVGLGLGLHISKTIIEQHQGQVGVESTVGKGSTFWFTIPLALPG